jgi:DinB superfamily
MDAAEKRDLLAALESGRKKLLKSLEGLTEEAAARRPAPGRWSAVECVEHLAVAEEHLFSQIATAQPDEGTVLDPGREALIRTRGVDRSRKVPSPEVGLPKGRFSTLAEVLDRFIASRDRTIRFVESCEQDLRARFTTHPIIGKANCYEMLWMMAIHPLRHAEQIAEIRAGENGNPISQ